MKYPRFFSRKPVFLGTVYKMSKSRVIGAGAGIGRANGGGGYNTGGNQGGGNKKQGLIGTTNMRVGLVPYVRTRADGGNARHWTFCMNQLGGVGRRWGQAAGPGNRGGVHAMCKMHAHRSRQRYPRRPKQSIGYGNPNLFRVNPVLGAATCGATCTTTADCLNATGCTSCRVKAGAMTCRGPPGPPRQLTWTKPTAGARNTPLVRYVPPAGGDELLIYGSDDPGPGYVYALYQVDATDWKLAWSFPCAGPVVATPVLDAGANRLYVCADGGTGEYAQGTVYALNPATGEQQWQRDIGGRLRAAVAGAAADAPSTRMLFVGSSSAPGKATGMLYALDPTDGTIAGQQDTPSIPRCMVYVAGGGVGGKATLCVSFDDGSVQCYLSLARGLPDTPFPPVWPNQLTTGAGALGDMSLSPSGTTLWFGSESQLLYGVQVGGDQGGKLLPFLTLPPSVTGGRVRAAPAIENAANNLINVYVSSDDGNVYAVKTTELAGNPYAPTPQVTWKQQIANESRVPAPTCYYGVSSPVVSPPFAARSRSTVYVGSYDGYVLGLDASGGTIVLQSHDIVPAGISTPLLSADGEDLYVSASVPCNEAEPTGGGGGSIVAIKVRNVCCQKDPDTDACDTTASNVCDECTRDYLADQATCDKCGY